jgi:subtilisin family serine protease/fibronectin type 3 domain-containing protein
LLQASFVAIALAVLAQIPTASQGRGAPRQSVVVNGHLAVANEVLVQFVDMPGAVAAQQGVIEQQIDADTNEGIGRQGLRRFRSRSFDVETLLAFFQGQPGVLYAEPNYLLTKAVTPNDPDFPNLWGLHNTGQSVFGIFGTPEADIDAPEAWDISTGSTSVVVGVIDTGVDYTHPDLSANIWSAPSSFTVNIGGIMTTCPAGSHGFNAITHVCDPFDDEGHGTHVSGTIGARGDNGIGVTGVNWITRIIGGKFLDSGGFGSTADAIQSIDFMIQAKAAFPSSANVRVLNNSWGGGGFSTSLQTAISNANTNNMLFVAAAGNGGADGIGDNNDIVPFYPASYAVANVLAVASTTSNDLRSSFSNYGATSVDLAAPGSRIWSTIPGGGYGLSSGTSMATPQVSGAAALVLSECSLSTAALKANLMDNVDPIASLAGLIVTGGRLNVNRSIRDCGGVHEPPAAPTGLVASGDVGSVFLNWNGVAGADSYRVKRSTTPGGPYTTIASGVTATSHVDSSVSAGITYFYVVSAVNGLGESGNSNEASATPFEAIPTAPAGLVATPGDSRVDLSWLPSSGATAYRVKRSLVKAGPFVQIAQVPGTSHSDLTVVNGTKYFYVVTALNGAGESGTSNKVNATPGIIPATPTGVAAATGTAVGQIDISWNASAGATSYKVRRSKIPGGPYKNGQQTTATSLTLSGLISGKRYYLVVTALSPIGESAQSVEVTAVAR